MTARKLKTIDKARTPSGNSGIRPIEEIIEDFRVGRMVILVDDEDRENEGDLVVAAGNVDAAAVNFMAVHGRGLICLTLTHERCRQLNLPLMVTRNNERYSTNFTVSIEAARGVTTGISAADRATTIAAAVADDAGPDDIVMPGHIFPVMARPGGVLARAGHTEAGVDLARLAGMSEPASVICEVLNEDGTMARLPDLLRFGQTHGIKVGTIADLIRYRLENEPTVQRIAQSRLDTRYGEFRLVMYHDIVDYETHLALIRGEPDPARVSTVRVHVSTGLGDVLGQIRGRESWSVLAALQEISSRDCGVLLVLSYPLEAGQLADRIHSLGEETESGDDGDDLRMLGLGGQILADLNVGRMRVLGTPKKTHGLSGFGLEIEEFINYPET